MTSKHSIPLIILHEDGERISNSLTAHHQQLAGSEILITGASGFLMGHVVDALAWMNLHALSSPCRMTLVDNLSSGSSDRFDHLAGRDDITFVEGDITQPLPDHLPAFDWTLHGASIASPMIYRKYPLETLDANITGTRLLLERARQRGGRGIMIMSSSEIYGDAEVIPTPETYWGNVSCTGPRACYDESKRVGETLASIFAQQFDVPVKVGRPFNVFGPIQNLDDKRIFPDFLSATLDKRQISILSDGRATRSFCYVSDAVTAILLILLAGRQGEAYNLGNDQREISVNELAQLFVALEADHAGIVSAKSADQDYETDNPQRRKPDLEKIRRELGYRPLIDLEAGILRTLAAYRS